jgi:hypothetical protein
MERSIVVLSPVLMKVVFGQFHRNDLEMDYSLAGEHGPGDRET